MPTFPKFLNGTALYNDFSPSIAPAAADPSCINLGEPVNPDAAPNATIALARRKASAGCILLLTLIPCDSLR